MRLYDQVGELARSVTRGLQGHNRSIDDLRLRLSLLEERVTWEPIRVGTLPPMFGQWYKGSHSLRLSRPVDVGVVGVPVSTEVAAFVDETMVVVLASSQVLTLSAAAFRSSGQPW